MSTDPFAARQRRTSSIVLSACILVMMFVMGWTVAQGGFLMGLMWLLIAVQGFVALALISTPNRSRKSGRFLTLIGIGMVPVVVAIAIVGAVG